MAKKRSWKANKPLARRLGIKSVRMVDGRPFKLNAEVEPISGTPDMFVLRERADRQGRSYRFEYSKKHDTGLFYLGPKKKTKRKR